MVTHLYNLNDCFNIYYCHVFSTVLFIFCQIYILFVLFNYNIQIWSHTHVTKYCDNVYLYLFLNLHSFLDFCNQFSLTFYLNCIHNIDSA